DAELAWAEERGLAAVEADALLGGPYIHARKGDFELARTMLQRSKAICRELGLAYGLCEAGMAGGEAEAAGGVAPAAGRPVARGHGSCGWDGSRPLRRALPGASIACSERAGPA